MKSKDGRKEAYIKISLGGFCYTVTRFISGNPDGGTGCFQSCTGIKHPVSQGGFIPVAIAGQNRWVLQAAAGHYRQEVLAPDYFKKGRSGLSF